MLPGAPSAWREWRRWISTGALVAALAAGAGVASAAGGGGGVGSPSPPTLTDVICLQRCADVREATVGSVVQLSGRSLDGADAVRFAAAGGGRVTTAPTSVGSNAIEVEVPERAASGTVRARAYGVEAETPAGKPLKVVAPGQIPEGGRFELTAAEAVPRRAFYDAPRAPRVSYVFQGEGPTDVRIEIVNRETRAVVDTLIQPDAQPGTRNSAKWDARTSAGALAPGADYKFEIGLPGVATRSPPRTPASATTSTASRSTPATPTATGSAPAADTRARTCSPSAGRRSTPPGAAGCRPSTCSRRPATTWSSTARRTGIDTMYAHLLRRSPLREGARVRTGQVIGNVGQTGNASGCHLHFEIWTAPGWYEGGNPMPSVARLLRAWDRWS